MNETDREAQFIETFRQEAREHLNIVEDALLDMEENPDDSEPVNRIFRAMHTIKGSGAMFGFDEIAGFAHHAETVLDRVREGGVKVTGGLVDLIFLVKDQLKGMLDSEATGHSVDPEICEKIVSRLNAFLGESESLPEDQISKTSEEISPTEKQGMETFYRIRFCPPHEIMMSGMDPVTLLNELRSLGSPCEITAETGGIPDLEALNPDKIFFSWDIILSTASGINAIKDVFIFVEEDSEISIKEIEKDQGRDSPRLGEILVDRGDADISSINKALLKQKKLGQVLVESGELSEDRVKSALVEQSVMDRKKSGSNTESVRISSDKLDRLINLVGEMVISQAHMKHLAEDRKESVFALPVRQMDRLVFEMRSFALDMRMLPVGTLFNKFRRLVRDLSSDLGKNVGLVIEGGETELDKTILEKLHDPMIHLIRNSMDHGIRPPEENEQYGKPRKGTIKLTASHRGGRVLLTVTDDGMGINTESVREKAIEKGIIAQDADLPEEEIHQLLFMPGFSTAREVTGVSGRGVGMDVVKKEIDSLSGTISIKSTRGKGTSFCLSMPLTLAIIEGLHVKIEDRNFIIPVSQVEKCGEYKRQVPEENEDKTMVRFKGELLPFIRLRDFFKIPGEIPAVEHLAAFETGHYRTVIVIDKIAGSIQTVIKPLDPLYQSAQGISGATVLGDGTIALIIDIPDLIQCVKRERLHSGTHERTIRT